MLSVCDNDQLDTSETLIFAMNLEFPLNNIFL